MYHNNIELGYGYLSESVQMMQTALDTNFFEAYVENSENILDNGEVRVVDGIPNPEIQKQLENNYKALLEMQLTPEEKRKVAQLVLLNGLKAEAIQANHQLTPDSIGFLFVYLIEEIIGKRSEPILIGDLAVGMGNLLYTVLTNLQLAKREVVGFGVDIDETLLQIASVNSHWLDVDATLYHQDSLSALLIEPLDIAIGDFPIGYYPNDAKIQSLKTASNEEHTYAHHALMEQSMKYVKPNGFGLFLLPNNFLETPQSDCLKKWMGQDVYLQGILKLPDQLFSQKSLGKSIVLIQNKGDSAHQAQEVLLAELPSLKNSQNVLNFVNQFRQWRKLNIN